MSGSAACSDRRRASLRTPRASAARRSAMSAPNASGTARNASSKSWTATWRWSFTTCRNGPWPFAVATATVSAASELAKVVARTPKRAAAYITIGSSTRWSHRMPLVPCGTTVRAPKITAPIPAHESASSPTKRGVHSLHFTPIHVSANGTTASAPSAFMRHQPSQPE